MIKELIENRIKKDSERIRIKATILAETDRGQVYTNVRFLKDGVLADEDNIAPQLVQSKVFFFTSDQGYIVMLHGREDGKVQVENEFLDLEELVSRFQMAGEWILISCFNKAHRAGKIGNCVFRKPKALDTWWPIVRGYSAPGVMRLASPPEAWIWRWKTFFLSKIAQWF